MAIIGHPAPAIVRAPVLAIHNIRQAIRARQGTDDNITAIAAVTAIGAALGDVFFTPKAAATRSAIASLDINRYTINKHDCSQFEETSTAESFHHTR
jgi:hypothetical protein